MFYTDIIHWEDFEQYQASLFNQQFLHKFLWMDTVLYDIKMLLFLLAAICELILQGFLMTNIASIVNVVCDDQPHDPHAAAAADGPLGVRHAVTAVSVVTDTFKSSLQDLVPLLPRQVGLESRNAELLRVLATVLDAGAAAAAQLAEDLFAGAVRY